MTILLNYQTSGTESTSFERSPLPPFHGGKGCEKPSLGIYAKSCPIPNPDSAVIRRVERYAMQSCVRSFVPQERVAKCLRNAIGDQVTIKHNTAKDSFGYRNLETCGSVWMCPVCAAKISEKRRIELVEGVSRWHDRGGIVVMLTLTVQHTLRDNYKKTLSGLTEAYRKLLKSCVGVRTLSGLRCVGKIRALETTFGENGWHPHIHTLLFLDTPYADLDAAQKVLLNQWKIVCVRSGLGVPNSHGLTIKDGSYASQYVSKWGIESEITKGHIKKSRSGYSPFDLPRFELGTYTGDAKPLAPGQAKILFKEYAYAMKGKRQLVWSDGLRDLLQLGEEKTDQQLVDEVEIQEIEFVRIPLVMWKVILKAEKRGEVLESCKLGLKNFFSYCEDIWLEYS